MATIMSPFQSNKALFKIGHRPIKYRFFSKSLDIPSDGPPPVGQVSSRSIPKHLRSFDKVFQVRACIFDFSLLIRDTPIKELVPHAQLISGFDPRHDRYQNYAPKHDVRGWVKGMTGGELMSELERRNIGFDGDVDMLKEKLVQQVKEINDKWISGLFGREIREELKAMGLESHGKIEELHHRMSTALLEGYGVPSKHYNMALVNAQKSPLPTTVSSSSNLESILTSSVTLDRGNPEKPNNIYPESQLPKELTDITTKYRKKLLAKTGGSLSSMKLSNEPTKGDAEGLNIGRKALIGANQNNSQKLSKWLPDSNVGDLMAYLETRSMKVYLLPNKSNKKEELETFRSHFPGVTFMIPDEVRCIFERFDQGKEVGGEYNQSTAKNQSSNGGFLSGFFSSFTGGGVKNKKTNNKRKSGMPDKNATKAWMECLKQVASSDALDIEPGKMVVISDKNELLQAGRDLSCYTVAFNPPNQRKVDISCDFSAEVIFDVKEFIEQENGISYRK